MRIGVIVSILVHIALLGWALYSVTATRTLSSTEDVPINVELVSIGDIPNIRQGDKNAKTEAVKGEKDKTKQTEKPAKAKNDRVAIVAPTKKEEVKAKDVEKKEEVKVEPKKEEPKVEPKKEEPPPEPKKEEVKKEETASVPEKKKEEPKKEEPKKAEKKPEPKKEAKAVKAKKELDLDKISALLDKQPNAAAEASTTKASAKPKEKPKLQIGATNGTGDGLTVSEEAILKKLIDEQIGRCLNVGGGQQEADYIKVTVQFNLEADGTLKGAPRTLNAQNSPLFLITEERVVRAVWECQPYSFPEKLYRGWRQITYHNPPPQAVN